LPANDIKGITDFLPRRNYESAQSHHNVKTGNNLKSKAYSHNVAKKVKDGTTELAAILPQKMDNIVELNKKA